MSTNTGTPEKRALLVGINKYPKLEPRYELKGCQNDVALVSQVIKEKFGFADENVTTLLNEEASRDNIRNAMQQLVDDSSKDDIVFMYYSGHGSRRRARRPTKPSGKDATIIASDSGRGKDPNRDVIDDEIHEWLGELSQKTPYITLFFDCCHSGTISRDVFSDMPRWVEEDTRSLEEMGIEEIPEEAATRSLDEFDTQDRGPSGWLAISESHVLMAGCRDEEYSYEYNQKSGGKKVKHGALTFFLCQELLKSESGMTYRDVFERARMNVTAAQPKQHPQIEGKLDRAVMGIEDIQPLRFISVKARKDDVVTLGGGAAHGLTVGSQWGIYPQGTKHVDQTEDNRIGFVEIVSVAAITAQAKIIDATAEIKEACRAVEEKHVFSEMCLTVDVSRVGDGYVDQVAELKQQIEESDLLKLADPSTADDADLCTYIIEPRENVSPGDRVPQLGAITEPTWALVDRRGGQLMMPARAVSQPDAVYIIGDNLVKQSRYRNALNLRNTNVSNVLEGKIQCKLKRKNTDGDWEEAIADEKTGQVIFESDDLFSFEITNNHSEPVFISLLDFGLTGGISLLHPSNKPSDKYEPGVTVKLFDQDVDAMDLYMPDTFDGNEGSETFKLFVTTQESDFSWMGQEGMRSLQSPIEQLFSLAYQGQGTRDTRKVNAPPADEWLTIEKEIVLKRKQGLDA